MMSQKNHLYQVLCDESQLGIVALNSKMEMIYVNRVAHDTLEIPMDQNADAIGVTSLYPTSSSLHRMRLMTVDTLEMEGLIQEIIMRKMNGQNFVATLSVKKVSIDGENHTLLTFQDVTLQKKLQRELMEKQNAINMAYQELLVQNKQLKELDLAKNRFIAMTTHELRTPLSAMTASAEILHLNIYDTKEQHDEFVKMIYDQGQHMLNLVNDILDYAKIQANKMDYYVEFSSPYSTVEADVEALTTMAEQAKVKLNFKQNPNDVFECYYDSVRLKQVVANLVNNAIKYNKPEGTVTVWLENHEKHVEVHIQDTGKGIDKEDHDKIFNEFETLGKTANHSKGTGLGLPISKKMIESMGGTLKLESATDVGSHFWITIPKEKVLPEENYRSRPDQSGDLAA